MVLKHDWVLLVINFGPGSYFIHRIFTGSMGVDDIVQFH